MNTGIDFEKKFELIKYVIEKGADICLNNDPYHNALFNSLYYKDKFQLKFECIKYLAEKADEEIFLLKDP